LGYAEADPTADVDGLDAADKLAILASIAFGGRIKLDDVYCEGIRKISAADIAYADKLGFTIKLLAIAQEDIPYSERDGEPQKLEIKVHPTLLPQDHPLARVDGVYNAVLVEGEPLGQVMLFGPGAGEGATASAVVSDLLNVVANLRQDGVVANHPLLTCMHRHYCTIAPMSESVTRFYARIVTRDQPSVIGHLGMTFGKHEVSLESVVQIDICQENAEIVVVTHEVSEGKFRAALAEVEALAEVVEVPSVLRVW